MSHKNTGYLVKQGFHNIISNPLMSFASVGVLFTCLLLVGGAFLLYFNIQQGIKYVGSQSEIVLFVEDGVSEYNCRQYIQPQLENCEGIYEVEFISSSEGLEQMKQQISGGEELFELLDGQDVLPHSFRVKVSDPAMYDSLVISLANISGIGEVSADGKIANTLSDIAKAVALFAVVMVSVLLLASVFILSNTVRMVMFTRRKEIGIMKLVGATDSFVRLPFFIETVALGLISALLAFIALRIGYVGLTDYLSQMGVTAMEWSQFGWPLLGCFAGASFIVSLLAATFSIRKYLTV